MKRVKARRASKSGKHHVIKIYTTPDLVQEFAKRAKDQNRSVSGHGEYLVKIDLAEHHRETA
jgi:hypothetical protein